MMPSMSVKQEVNIRFRDGPAPISEAGGAVGIDDEDPSQALVIIPFTLGAAAFYSFASKCP